VKNGAVNSSRSNSVPIHSLVFRIYPKKRNKFLALIRMRKLLLTMIYYCLDMLSGLSKVLDLIQTVLKDGSMYLDYRGQTECRSFVLEQAGVYFLKRCQLEFDTQVHCACQSVFVEEQRVRLI